MAFEDLRYLFEGEIEALRLGGSDSEGWKELNEAITLNLDLRMMDEETSESIPFYFIHISGDKAWYVPRLQGVDSPNAPGLILLTSRTRPTLRLETA